MEERETNENLVNEKIEKIKSRKNKKCVYLIFYFCLFLFLTP